MRECPPNLDVADDAPGLAGAVQALDIGAVASAPAPFLACFASRERRSTPRAYGKTHIDRYDALISVGCSFTFISRTRSEAL